MLRFLAWKRERFVEEGTFARRRDVIVKQNPLLVQFFEVVGRGICTAKNRNVGL